jgi:hypothetical protein
VFLRFFENDSIQKPSFVIIEFDHHEILLSSSPMVPPDQGDVGHKSPIAVFLEGMRKVVIVLQWFYVAVIKPSHCVAISCEYRSAGHVQTEAAVLYG